MTKTWAKPFNAILTAKSGVWKAAETKEQRLAVIQEVAEAITEQMTLTDGEDRLPSHLKTVSIVLV
jgi:hypothetical protein